jgi:hypothetical protein
MKTVTSWIVESSMIARQRCHQPLRAAQLVLAQTLTEPRPGSTAAMDTAVETELMVVGTVAGPTIVGRPGKGSEVLPDEPLLLLQMTRITENAGHPETGGLHLAVEAQPRMWTHTYQRMGETTAHDAETIDREMIDHETIGPGMTGPEMTGPGMTGVDVTAEMIGGTIGIAEREAGADPLCMTVEETVIGPASATAIGDERTPGLENMASIRKALL